MPKIDNFTVKPHELREKIEIQQSVSGLDEDNIPINDCWETLLTTKAKVKTNKDDEEAMLQGEGDVIIKTFIIRNRKSLIISKQDNRIVYKAKIYDIKSVEDVQERGIWLVIKGEYKGFDINEYRD